MIVPKNPRPPDFCGCPPCPLCFVWMDHAPPRVVTKEDPITAPVEQPTVIDGIVRMGQELLGRDPIPEEMPALRRGAEVIHEQNLLKLKPQPQQADSFVERSHEKHIGMVCEAIIKDKVRERNAPKRKKLNHVNLDNMSRKKLAEKTNTDDPRVDQELLEREKASYRQSYKDKQSAYYAMYARPPMKR